MRTLEIGANRVVIADVVDVACAKARLTISPTTLDRLKNARDVVERAAQGDQSVYGLTSALGANTGKVVAPTDRVAYQVSAVRARAVGVGAAMEADRVRAAMFAR